MEDRIQDLEKEKNDEIYKLQQALEAATKNNGDQIQKMKLDIIDVQSKLAKTEAEKKQISQEKKDAEEIKRVYEHKFYDMETLYKE